MSTSTPNQRLRRERQLRGWSQSHVAKQIKVPDYYISRWERGDVIIEEIKLFQRDEHSNCWGNGHD